MSTILSMAPYAIAYTMPILITALGGMFSERSGIINLALDGIMTLGALAGVLCVSLLGPTLGYQTAVTLGILLGALVGVLTSVLLAFAAALAVYLSREIAGVSIVVINSLPRFDIPLLSKIPVLGPILFSSTYATSWLILALTVLSWYVIEKTPFGLRLRSCGENPAASAAAGIDVAKVRYSGVLISGAFAGLGGAVYALTVAGQSTGSVNGLGFIALAGLIFGQWRTFKILITTLFFGFALTIAQISTLWSSFSAIPPVYLKISPYLITLVVLIFSSKNTSAPRAEGKFFEYKK